MLKHSPNHWALRLPNDDDDIGKLYGDGYILSMLVDSDVYASVRLMLEWQQGNVAQAWVPVSTVARSILDMNATKWSDRLRYNYTSKSDKSASLFPPTYSTFQQYTIKYQVDLWIHSLEAKLVVWNPDGNGWQLRNNKHKMRHRNKFEISNISIASRKSVHRVEPVSA